MAISSARGRLIAVIGDEDTITGFLLGGIGELDIDRRPNYLAVTKDTPISDIEDAFKTFTSREDIAIILIVQNVADVIRHLVDAHTSPMPAVLEIPMIMSDYQLNADAEEFVPQVVKVENNIKDIVLEAFGSNTKTSEGAIRKFEQLIQSSPACKAAHRVGEALIRAAFIKSGNATVALKVFKELQASIPDSQYDLLENGFLGELHTQTIQVVSEEGLKEVANDTDSSKKFILFSAELIHLISQSVTNLRNAGSGVAPLFPCIDICILAVAALRTQLETTKKNPPPDSKAMMNWGNLIDAFISSLSQTLPKINALLQSSDHVPSSSSSWISTSCLREPSDISVLKNNPSINNVETLKVEHLALLLDEVLYLLKFLVVIDNGLPSRWVRSTAMDLLLSAAAVTTANASINHQDFGDDNLFDQDNQELMQDFEEFLETSGQL
ncbi:unnamed protein product [Rodentolepis nana]|uniref:V-type proton ATPase subunit F n=1 Tax=Rodentolepis nana TaxID=102285 RepID=A0A0R3T8N6_RODNA|nr:unnamed protein product [Rodentolepis nana]